MVHACVCHTSIGCFTTSYGRQCESPKQSGFAIFAQVPFHSLKAAHTVVQSLCSWVHRNVSKGLDHRLAPALPLNMFHYEHVICERLSKYQVLCCRDRATQFVTNLDFNRGEAQLKL